MVRISFACEVDPGIGDLRAKLAGLPAASGHIGATVGAIEDERQFRAMEGPPATVKNRGLPVEPVKIGWGGALGGLAFRLCYVREVQR
jgi:hypothetical protein